MCKNMHRSLLVQFCIYISVCIPSGSGRYELECRQFQRLKSRTVLVTETGRDSDSELETNMKYFSFPTRNQRNFPAVMSESVVQAVRSWARGNGFKFKFKFEFAELESGTLMMMVRSWAGRRSESDCQTSGSGCPRA